MTTAEVSVHLAKAAARFPFLGLSDAAQLREAVRLELGSEEALDDFVAYGGGHRTMAVGPGTILHVISGNTPHAGLQSLIRGLLLQARNLCKIPTAGLPEIAQFRDLLPPALAGLIEVSAELPDEWMASADAVIVFGSDETIAAVRARVSATQLFLPHGHKVSLGIIFDDPHFASVSAAASDASLFDQQGCLSPHGFYVSGDARDYAARLAAEMENFNARMPRRPITALESAAIRRVRDDFEFRTANDPRATVFTSRGSTDWTVILDPDAMFTPSCLNRVVFVKPLPEDLAAALAGVRPHLSTIAIWPWTLENARRVRGLGASRICEVGRMQSPPFTWHQDGGQTLAPLVRWIDAEMPPS